MQNFEIIFRSSEGILHYVTTCAENQEDARKWWMSRYAYSSELEVIRQVSGVQKKKSARNDRNWQARIFFLVESLTNFLVKII